MQISGLDITVNLMNIHVLSTTRVDSNVISHLQITSYNIELNNCMRKLMPYLDKQCRQHNGPTCKAFLRTYTESSKARRRRKSINA